MSIDSFEEFPVESSEELLTSIQDKIESDPYLSSDEKVLMNAEATEIISENPELLGLSISENILRNICEKHIDPLYNQREYSPANKWESKDYVQESLLERLSPEQVSNYVKNFAFLLTHNFPTIPLLRTRDLLTFPSDELYKKIKIIKDLPNYKQVLAAFPFLLSDEEMDKKVVTLTRLPQISVYNPKTIAKICQMQFQDLESFLKTMPGYPRIVPQDMESLLDAPVDLKSIETLSILEFTFRENPEAKVRLTTEQEHLLFKTLKDEIPKIEDKDRQKEIKNRIVSVIFQSNRRLIYKIMTKYGVSNNGSISEDYYLDGEDGLLRAINVFDYQRGTAFSTVAYIWIEQAISRAFYENQHEGVTQIPDPLGMAILRFKRLQKDYGNLTYGELASIAKDKGYDIPSQEEFEMFGSSIELDKPIKSDTYTTLGEMLNIKKGSSPESITEDRILVEELMSIFPSVYQQILSLSALGYNNKEIARIFKCTPENIRQKLAAAGKMGREFARTRSAQEVFDLSADI